jgi:hypothetical protein
MASPFELSYGIVSAMIRREADLIADFAKESGLLEQRVMLGEELRIRKRSWRRPVPGVACAPCRSHSGRAQQRNL